MKPLRKAALLCAVLCLVALSSVFPQGSLSPPGPPAPTMKSLDQIASTGVAVNATNTPGDTANHFIINAPGNYHLTGNLAVTKTNGIHITAPGVTLDMNGFNIARSSGTGGAAIFIDLAANGCTVRNGSIGDASGLTFLDGVQCQSVSAQFARGGAFVDLSVTATTSAGIVAGFGWVVERCRAHDCSGSQGIFAREGSTLSHCTVYGTTVANAFNTSENCTLDHCTAHNNTSAASFSAGFGLGLNNVAIGCVAEINATTNGAPTGNSGAGFFVASGVLKDCAANKNDGDGFVGLSSAALVLEDCSATSNQGNGIELPGDGNLVSHCVSNSNGKKVSPNNTTSDGIRIAARTRVIDCTAFSNAEHGINSTSANNRNYIEGCLLQGNTGFAIALQGNGNTVIRNEVGGNTGGTINQTGGNIAPTQAPTDTMNPINPLANFP